MNQTTDMRTATRRVREVFVLSALLVDLDIRVHIDTSDCHGGFAALMPVGSSRVAICCSVNSACRSKAGLAVCNCSADLS